MPQPIQRRLGERIESRELRSPSASQLDCQRVYKETRETEKSKEEKIKAKASPAAATNAQNTTEEKELTDTELRAWRLAWGDYCRRNIFGQHAMSWQLSPDRDAVNQKPWLDYCKGYFDAMFDVRRALGVICVPEGTKVFEVGGSVIVAYARASEEEKQRKTPPTFAMEVWKKTFPCKFK
jgi:hypothetical protein